MKKKNDNLCYECQYMMYDVLGNVRCTEKDTQLVSEYLPACYRFKERYTIDGTHHFVNLCKK